MYDAAIGGGGGMSRKDVNLFIKSNINIEARLF